MVLETKNINRMAGSPEFHNIPSDVTVESSTNIPKDLIASVKKTEKSFEDELRKFRMSTYLPAKYSGENRSNLHKQLNANMPGESDRLLGNINASGGYVGGSFNDDVSLTTEEQSHASKLTFGSTPLNLTDTLAAGKVETKTLLVDEQSKQQQTIQDEYESFDIESENSISINHLGCEHLTMGIHKNLKMHRLASDYFQARNFLFFQAPQAILAMTSAILAFIGVSDIFNPMLEKDIVTIAGCCAGLVVVLQTLSGYCMYGTRASMHEGTTIYLRDLDDDLALHMSNLAKAEMNQKKQDESEDQSRQKLQHNEAIFESLQSRYRHSLKGCKSDVPTEIREAFSEIDSFILLSRTKANRRFLKECGMFETQQFRGITQKAYDRLASNIVGHVYWPLKLPYPKTLVKTTIDETRADLHQMHSFWETPPDESCIPCLPFGNGARNRTTVPKFASF